MSDLSRFLENADELLHDIQRREDTEDPSVFEYFDRRLKVLDSALSRILLSEGDTDVSKYNVLFVSLKSPPILCALIYNVFINVQNCAVTFSKYMYIL